MPSTTWLNASAGLASTGTWSNGIPQNGWDVIADALQSANNMNWDLNISVNSFTATGTGGAITESQPIVVTGAFSISGWTWNTSTKTLTTGPMTNGTNATIAQTGTGGNITCTSYTQSGTGSVLTGKVGATFTCGGSFIRSAGTITNFVLMLTINGNGLVDTTSGTLSSLTIDANVAVNNVPTDGLTVNPNAIVTINATKTFTIQGIFTNNGKINGTGIFYVYLYSGNFSGKFGNIGAPIVVFKENVANNLIFTMSGLGNCGSTISVQCASATNTLTFNQAGYPLSASGLITFSGRSIISSSVAGASINAPAGITVAANGSIDRTNINVTANTYDSSAGTDTAGMSLMAFIGAGAALKQAGGQSVYNAIVTGTAGVLSETSNVTVGNLFAHVSPAVNNNGNTQTLTNPANEFTGLRRPIKRSLTPLSVATGLNDQWLNDLGAML